MFPKYAFRKSPTLVLAACVIFTSCNCAVAQTSVSFGQIRNLPAIDTEAHREMGKATHLFTIKDKKALPLPLVSQASKVQESKARIVSIKSLVPSDTLSQSNIAPAVSSDVAATPINAFELPQSNAAGDVASTYAASRTGHYTIAFGQPYRAQQLDEEMVGDAGQEEPDSMGMEQLETDASTNGDLGDDLETTDQDVDDLELAKDDEDDESADELAYDEDDTPIARPEIGPWPRKSIQEVRLNLVEHDAEAPEDRASRLFESSKRLDGNIAATEKVFAWAAPNINYQPLYFEDVALERYGQTKGLVKQPFVSAGKFLTDRLFLGTRALRVHPKSCDSPLGFCRPGSPSTVSTGGCGCACLNRSQEACETCNTCN